MSYGIKPGFLRKSSGNDASPWPLTGRRGADALRRVTLARCGISPMPTSVSKTKKYPLRMRVLERINTSNTSLCGAVRPKERGLAGNMLEALRVGMINTLSHQSSMPTHFFFENIEVMTIPAHPGSLCEQVSRFMNADVIVSVHGAHLSLATFMTQGRSVLIEVMPYGNYNLMFTHVVTAPIGIPRSVLCGRKDPTMKSCEKTHGGNRTRCQEFNRDCFKVTFGGFKCKGCQCVQRVLASVIRTLSSQLFTRRVK